MAAEPVWCGSQCEVNCCGGSEGEMHIGALSVVWILRLGGQLEFWKDAGWSIVSGFGRQVES
jgi:hypothetical protein